MLKMYGAASIFSSSIHFIFRLFWAFLAVDHSGRRSPAPILGTFIVKLGYLN